MTPREEEIEAFLQKAGWAQALRAPIPGDASTRLYARLTKENGQTAILMMAEADQKTKNFVRIDFLLRELGLIAPELYAQDAPRGLVLMEDFGGQNCGKLIDGGADRSPYDRGAMKALAQLHKGFKTESIEGWGLPVFNAELFAQQIASFLNFYFPFAQKREPTQTERDDFIAAWTKVLGPVDALPRTLMLRDFMPDNAMLLAAPRGDQTLGILDFQDAGVGPIAYDLCSWHEEVRRPGGLARMEESLAFYASQNPVLDVQTLLSFTRLLLAHQHMRVLGSWVRLKRERLIPCALRGLRELLKDEKLQPVSRWYAGCGFE